MGFDFDTWKEEAGQSLRALSAQIAQRTLPHTLNAILCGAALGSLVSALQQGEILPVMVALGTVAAGVGGNLLAEQV